MANVIKCNVFMFVILYVTMNYILCKGLVTVKGLMWVKKYLPEDDWK